MTKLRDYQIEIKASINTFLKSKEIRGQVNAPMGSGKTVTFTDLVKDEIENSWRPLKIAILHPRIALSQDQQSRFFKDFAKIKNVRIVSFHSGGVLKAEDNDQIGFGSIDANGLKVHQKNTMNENKSHIVFSSYQSYGKIADIEFDIVICDEAHYAVENITCTTAVQAIQAKKILFFTATPINAERDTDIGMNNEDVFGKIISAIEPKRLIKAGYLVAPLVHQLNVDLDLEGNPDVVRVIGDAFNFQKEEMTKTGMPYTKMLVSMTGSRQITELNDGIKDLRKIIGKNIPIFTITAERLTKNAKYAGKKSSERAALIREFSAVDGDAIICHIDTLAEGIDVESITGVLLLRRLRKVKLIQTIGRAVRPFVTADFDDNYEPKPFGERLKQRCVVSVPFYNGVAVMNSVEDLCRAFVDGGYGELSDYVAYEEDTDGEGEQKGVERTTGGGDQFEQISAQIKDIELEVKLANLMSKEYATDLYAF